MRIEEFEYIYVAGMGRVMFSEDREVYLQNIKDGIDCLCDCTSDHFSLDNLNNMLWELHTNNHFQCWADGYYQMTADHKQIYHLFRDPAISNYWEWRAAQLEKLIAKKAPKLLKHVEKIEKNRSISTNLKDVSMAKVTDLFDVSRFHIGIGHHEVDVERELIGDNSIAKVTDFTGEHALLLTYSYIWD